MAGVEGPFLLGWSTLTEHPFFFKKCINSKKKIAALNILMVP